MFDLHRSSLLSLHALSFCGKWWNWTASFDGTVSKSAHKLYLEFCFFFVFPFLVLGSFGCLLCIQTGESYRVFLMALFWWVGRIRTTVRRADNRSRESGKKNKTNENKHATTTSAAAAAAAAAATTTKQKGKSRNLLTNRWLMVLKRQSVEVPSDYLPLSLNGWTAFSRAKIGKRRKETEKKSGK